MFASGKTVQRSGETGLHNVEPGLLDMSVTAKLSGAVFLWPNNKVRVWIDGGLTGSMIHDLVFDPGFKEQITSVDIIKGTWIVALGSNEGYLRFYDVDKATGLQDESSGRIAWKIGASPVTNITSFTNDVVTCIMEDGRQYFCTVEMNDKKQKRFVKVTPVTCDTVVHHDNKPVPVGCQVPFLPTDTLGVFDRSKFEIVTNEEMEDGSMHVTKNGHDKFGLIGVAKFFILESERIFVVVKKSDRSVHVVRI